MAIVCGVLIKFKIPEKIFYKSFHTLINSVKMHKLDNFSIINLKKGSKRPNLFALKLIEEKTDYVISPGSI